MKFCQSLMYAPPADWLELTRCAEGVGFDAVSLSDHVFYPGKLESSYPYSSSGRPIFPPETPWPDVWVTTGALAAATERIRFATHVYVLPARNPFVVAKAVGTAAFLSGDRVLLGVGAGWMREEFDLLGQPFDNRGKRLNEMIPALRALWAGGWVSWSGEYYQVPELMLEPHPPAPVPIMCGGESEAALRRAARLCDGWVGTAYLWDDAVRHVERLHALRREYGRDDEPFDIMLALMDVPTPDLYQRAEDIGITAVMCAPWMGSADVEPGDVASFRRPIEQFAETVMAKVR
jgi:probable F420-dependent oxidoreductase